MADSGTVRHAGAAVLVAVTVLSGAVACARQGSPPGGPPDGIPPYIVATTPDTFEVVEPFGGGIRVEFNERISERVSGGGINSAVEISPRTGDVRVKHRRQSIDITMAGGFVEGVVYRVTVLPVIQDMFGNSLREAFEFFFSTGPGFTDNVLAGALEDRITGQPVPAARVDAWQAEGDSVVQTTVSDADGIFALRRIPEGSYQVRAYVDVNRTFEPDFIELQGGAAGYTLGPADTVLAFFDMLQPDTTPARLIGVDAQDSLTLELGFDDFLDPDSALDALTVSLAPDSTQPDLEGAPTVTRLLHAHRYLVYADSVRAVADSLAALAALADTTGGEAGEAVEPGRLPPPGPPVPSQAGAGTDEGRPLPSQLIYAVLDGPMVAAGLYRVTVSGVTNLVGLTDGGGEAVVSAPEPPPPDTASTDSLAVPDGTGVQPDSVPVDTTTAPEVPVDSTTTPASPADTSATPAAPADTSAMPAAQAPSSSPRPTPARPAVTKTGPGRVSARPARPPAAPTKWFGMRRLRD